MKFSLPVAALFAIYSQALGQQGVGEFRIFEERSGAPRSLSIQGETPIFELATSDYENWRINQVGGTSDGDKIVNIQSASMGAYLSCSATDEKAPCELKQSKYSIQPFVEKFINPLDGSDGIYLFFDEKTEKFLSSNDEGYLTLTASDDDEIYYVLAQPEEAGDN